MDWTVFFLAIISLGTLTMAVAAVIALVHLALLEPLLRGTLQRIDQTLDRLNAIGGDLEQLTRRFNRMEERVSDAVNPLLNQVLPPLRGIAAVLAGLRTGMSVLARRNSKISQE